ncbi:hypothetical protein CCHR01_02737 [Colletotrichum chrysophilum]|uniref:Uncharacterized protein n=1 Tax=Colletotrichum chrysophilum TaxID=1836956 RepID=A0AAD9AU33_9PEZI|nr:hypothetical protein CCHR01_02737 [Colletotrichum chrysophilum]
MMTFCPLLQSLHISVAIYLASIARQGKMSHKALAVKWGRRCRFQEHYPWLIFARKKKCHAHPRQFGFGAALHLHQKNAWARSMPGLPGKIGVVGSSSTHLPVFYLHRGEYPKEKAGKGHHGNYARLPIDNTVKPYTNSYPPVRFRFLNHMNRDPAANTHRHTVIITKEKNFQTRDHVSHDTWKEFRASIGYTFQREKKNILGCLWSVVSIVYSVCPRKTGHPRPPNPPSSLNPRQGRQKGIHHKGEREREKKKEDTRTRRNRTSGLLATSRETQKRKKKKVSFRVFDGKTRDVCGLVSCKVR